jgi:hypothetical protein
MLELPPASGIENRSSEMADAASATIGQQVHMPEGVYGAPDQPRAGFIETRSML